MRKNVKCPPILNDEKFLYCISLANLSRNDRRNDEVYGSILIKGNCIIGTGFNRAIVHPKFRLERTIRQGLSNHAEIEALNDALSKGFNVEEGDIYVAGYFLKSGHLFLQKKYTCSRCLPYLEEYSIGNIYIPAPEGWIKKSLDIAGEDAEEFKKCAYKKRQHERIGNYLIGSIKSRLPDLSHLRIS